MNIDAFSEIVSIVISTAHVMGRLAIVFKHALLSHELSTDATCEALQMIISSSDGQILLVLKELKNEKGNYQL